MYFTSLFNNVLLQYLHYKLKAKSKKQTSGMKSNLKSQTWICRCTNSHLVSKCGTVVKGLKKKCTWKLHISILHIYTFFLTRLTLFSSHWLVLLTHSPTVPCGKLWRDKCTHVVLAESWVYNSAITDME